MFHILYFQTKSYNKNINELFCEIKYRLATQNEFNKKIEDLYNNRLKKCYQLMNIEKQDSLKVSYLIKI